MQVSPSLIEFNIGVGATETVAFFADGQVVRVLLHDLTTVRLGVVMMSLIDIVVIRVNYRL